MYKGVLLFSNSRLLKKLRKREIKATIRTSGYIKRLGLGEGKIVRVLFKRGKRRESLGFVKITRIRETTFGLLTDEIARICGHDTLEDLRKWIKIFLRFKEVKDSTRVYIVEFEWLEGGTLEYYIPTLAEKPRIEEKKN